VSVVLGLVVGRGESGNQRNWNLHPHLVIQEIPTLLRAREEPGSAGKGVEAGVSAIHG
jgi:hypothetical protein